MEDNKQTNQPADEKKDSVVKKIFNRGVLKRFFNKDKAHTISRKESRQITKENFKITRGYEKRKKRKNVPETEYVTQMKDNRNIVEFDNLHTYFFTDAGTVRAVNGVTFSIPQGSTVGVVGESGCGKSVTSLSLMQLVQAPHGQVINDDKITSQIRFKSTVFKEKDGKKIPVYEYETDENGNKVIKQSPVYKKGGGAQFKKGKPVEEKVVKLDEHGQPMFKEENGKKVPVYETEIGKDGVEKIKTRQVVKPLIPVLDSHGNPVLKPVQKTDSYGIPVFETEEKVYDMTRMPTKKMRKIRGREITMIFQEPMTSLNPIFRIGDQLDEVVLLHAPGATKASAKARTYEMLKLVGIIPENVYRRYPHELSGGMRQRVVIAMALMCNPKLIIADEPTTALDVTIQAQILELLRDIKDKISGSIMLITHDLGVIAEMADFVVVMYAGRIVEMGTAYEIFKNPMHPYTIGLQKSKPSVSMKVDRLYSIPGSVPNPINMPKHCYFRGRCNQRAEICASDYPCMLSVSPTHKVACHLYADKYPIDEDSMMDAPEAGSNPSKEVR